jgi:hypothetical protein
MSIRALAAKYSISESEIKTACKNHNIPTPLNGHWTKLEFNKPVTIIPLPDKQNENQEIVFKSKINEHGEITKELSPLKTLQKEIEECLGNKLDVPERLTNPDKAIIATKEIVSGKIKYSDNEYYDVLKESMHIKVSKEQALRALRIIDTLTKALRARGHKVNISHSTTTVTINGQNLEIGLREKTKRVKRESNSRYDSYDYVHVGILIIKVIESYSDKEFADGKLPLEKQLSLIIASFEIWANEMNERQERWRLDQIKRDEEKRIQKDFEKRQDDDLEAFRKTLNKADRWHKTENLRNYINEVESKAIANNKLTEEIKAWLIWARKKADWYDPFIESPDELLNNADKDTLTIKGKSYY